MRRSLLLLSVLACVACASLKHASPDDTIDGGGGSPGGSDDGGPSATTTDDGGVTARGDDGSAPAAGDPRWPNWKMPSDTPTAADFTITNGADGAIVTDTKTGLSWQDTPLAGTFAAAEATPKCADLVYDGLSDWRAPTRIELVSLMVFGTTVEDSALTSSAFSATPGTSCFWAGSTAVFPSYGWRARQLAVDIAAAVNSCGVRCVRGGAALPQAAVKRTYVLGTATVTDPWTGLVWERTPGAEAKWGAADARCKALDLDGKPGRLPTVKELSSIVDETVESPASSPVFQAVKGRYHTSNERWIVDFTYGSTEEVVPVGASYPSRCVR